MNMRNLPRVISFWIVTGALSASAQYDIGISGGVFRFSMFWPKFNPLNNLDERHVPSFSESNELPRTASVWYRERGKRPVGLQVEAQWTEKSFHVNYSTGGLGSGSDYSVDVVAHFLHFQIGPEFKFGKRKLFYFRTGHQFGFIISGSHSLTSNGWSIVSGYSDGVINNERFYKNYLGDLRWTNSLGCQLVEFGKVHVSFDTFFSLGLSSIHNGEPSMASNDIGIRISVAARVNKRSFCQLIGGAKPLK